MKMSSYKDVEVLRTVVITDADATFHILDGVSSSA